MSALVEETEIKINEVTLIDKFVNTKTESGDEEINNQESNKDNELKQNPNIQEAT